MEALDKGQDSRDFITLLRTVCNLKLMNFLLLGFTFNILGLWLTVGN